MKAMMGKMALGSVVLVGFSLGLGRTQARPPASVAPLPKSNAPTYIRDIKPILTQRCVVCHNRAALKNREVSGGLALDSFAGLKEGLRAKKPLYVLGKPAESELIRRLEVSSPTLLMPKGGPVLPAAQVALVKKWIEAGVPTGDLAKEGIASAPAKAELLPANAGLFDTRFRTNLASSPDMRDAKTPADAPLQFSLKIAPLPAVTALAYSPDGKTLAVGGYRSVALWDVQTGKPTVRLVGLAGAVQSLAFRPDGKALAIAGGVPGKSGEVRIYDCATQRLLETTLATHTDLVYHVAWSQNGERLASASQDKTARVWEMPAGKELFALKEHTGPVMRVAFTSDGKSLYTAGVDRSPRRYDTSNGSLTRTFSGHEDAVLAFAVSPKGDSIVSAGMEPRLRWWNPNDGNTTRFTDGNGSVVNEIAFSPDGKRFASVAGDGWARIWEASNEGQRRDFDHRAEWLYALALSPDNKFLATGGAEGVVRIWQIEPNRLRLSLVAWNPLKDKTSADWVAVTPEGYCDGSAAWLAKVRLTVAEKAIPSPRLAQIRPMLQSPENVLKAWQGADLPALKIPDPPTKPAPKPPAPKS